MCERTHRTTSIPQSSCAFLPRFVQRRITVEYCSTSPRFDGKKNRAGLKYVCQGKYASPCKRHFAYTLYVTRIYSRIPLQRNKSRDVSDSLSLVYCVATPLLFTTLWALFWRKILFKTFCELSRKKCISKELSYTVNAKGFLLKN